MPNVILEAKISMVGEVLGRLNELLELQANFVEFMKIMSHFCFQGTLDEKCTTVSCGKPFKQEIMPVLGAKQELCAGGQR
jgi:hypothetical protein